MRVAREDIADGEVEAEADGVDGFGGVDEVRETNVIPPPHRLLLLRLHSLP